MDESISEELLERFTTFFKEFKDETGEHKYKPLIDVLRTINRPCCVLNIDMLDVLTFDPRLFGFFKEPLLFNIAADTVLRNLVLANTQEDVTPVKVFIVSLDFTELAKWLHAQSHPISAPENKAGGELKNG